MDRDTIGAVATSVGIAGIGIVRVSGDQAIGSVSNIFKSKKGQSLDMLSNRKIHYGWIVEEDGKIIDEVLVVPMKRPYTYTKEDVVEIHCHGGIVSVERILKKLLDQGVRLAERGEFTKRAFLNGRIDLSQAEAVMDLVSAKTKNSFQLSMNQLQGRLSQALNDIRKQLVDMLAHIEVNIDFPEYDEEEVTREHLLNISREIESKIFRLIETSEVGMIHREGIKTLILGKPNVGKSSLMNYLLNENRAIVTDIPGTTRDTIEEFVNLAGVPLKIIDTAGIRQTEDIVEKIGVEKALHKIDEADLILVVFDGSRYLEEEDLMIMEKIKDKKALYLLNKTDLEEKISFDSIPYIKDVLIRISIINNEGLMAIEKEVKKLFLKASINVEEDAVVNNIRHKNLLLKAKSAIKDVIQSIEDQQTIDCIEVDIMETLEYLGEITGDAVREDLVDKIFSDFCIGK